MSHDPEEGSLQETGPPRRRGPGPIFVSSSVDKHEATMADFGPCRRKRDFIRLTFRPISGGDGARRFYSQKSSRDRDRDTQFDKHVDRRMAR